MRAATLLLLAVTGCVTTTEVRHEMRREIAKLKTRQSALESRFSSIGNEVRRIEGLKESIDRELTGAKEAARSEAKASSVDALREVRELRGELNESLDEAVARMRGDLNRLEGELRKADAERVLRVQDVETQVASLRRAAEETKPESEAMLEVLGTGIETLKQRTEAHEASRTEEQTRVRAELDRLRTALEGLEKAAAEMGRAWQARHDALDAALATIQKALEKASGENAPSGETGDGSGGEQSAP